MKKTSHPHPLSSSLDSFAEVFLHSTQSKLLRKAASNPTEGQNNAHPDEESSQERCERRQDVEAIDHVYCDGREGVDAKEAEECNTEPPIDKKGRKKKSVTFSNNVRVEVYSFETASLSVDDDGLYDYDYEADDCNIFDLIFCVACC